MEAIAGLFPEGSITPRSQGAQESPQRKTRTQQGQSLRKGIRSKEEESNEMQWNTLKRLC